MRNENRISGAARLVLRSMRGTPLTLPELLTGSNVRHGLMARWFRRRIFRQALRGVLGEIRRMGEVELELAARAALRICSEALSDPPKRQDRFRIMVCAELLRAQQELHRQQLRKPRRTPARLLLHKRPPGPRLHPSIPEDQAKAMLKRLYARHLQSKARARKEG